MGQHLNLRIFDSVEKLVPELAASIAERIRFVLKEKDHFDLLLTGGNTPRPLYKFLADNYREKIPWGKIKFFWSDERYVPHNDPRSNFGMAKETLLNRVPIDPANVFPMLTSFKDPAEASDAYEKLLMTHFIEPHFDLALLGMGENCHVASLFPHTVTLGEDERWVVASISPKEPIHRLSLTFPAINGSRLIYFLVTGENKASALQKALSKDQIEIEDCPVRGLKPVDGEIIWWVDRAAARLVQK